MTKDMEAVYDKLDAVRRDLLHSMAENELEPNEALTLLTSVLIQIYGTFVENNSRENFVNILGQSYDTYALITAKPEGSIQ